MSFRDDRDAMIARLAALERDAVDVEALRKRVAELEAENAQLAAELTRLRPPPPPPRPPQSVPRTLVFRVSDHTGIRDITLAQTIIKIGRVPSAHLQIDDKDASRMHAVIESDVDHVTIIDLGSSIGMLVNGQKVNKAQLQHGDEIRIGATVIRVGISGDG